MTEPMPSFPEFYRAINGRGPFPWQTRLAECVDATERWPQEIGVPTGLGKTACLEIAIWCLAAQADRFPAQRSVPTRIWWVVNRRLLVDSTADHANKIAGSLGAARPTEQDNSGGDVLSRVADRLRSLSADRDAPPLEVISLRGGIASRTAATDPSRPTVVLCTLPMYGSRLLFRGYGSTLRAVDAAMAGTDSLVLLDEAHLAPHLRSLVGALGECTPDMRPILPDERSRATVVALTATGDADEQGRFDLTEEDERAPLVRKRLDAVKSTDLRVSDTPDAGRHLAEATAELMGEARGPASFLVFANSPITARDVHRRLRKHGSGSAPEVILLTGLTREREAEQIRARVLDPASGMPAGRDNLARSRHLIVVATQTLEVGADLDAEYLVTEACGVRALTQRLGRLNRLGRFPHARALYVHVPPPKRRRGRQTPQAPTSWPVYGEEPAYVLERLQNAAGEGKGTVDLCPRRVAQVLGPAREDPDRAPEVLPGILWEWVKTTSPPEGEAPVEPYFSGIAGPQYAVSVLWRVHMPEEGERLWPRATDREAVDVPLAELRDALGEGELVHRLAGDGATVETVAPHDLRPGAQVVLPTDRGLLDEFGWDASATEPVVDVSLVGRGLPLDAVAIKRLCDVSLGDAVSTALGIGDEEVDETERDGGVREIVSRVRDAAPPRGWGGPEWTEFTDSLEHRVVEARREVPRLIARNPLPEPRVGEFDETSLGATVELEAHGDAVGVRARVVADRIGVPPDLRDVVALAGTLHDIGKADGRFQRWLDPEGRADVPMAKSNMPRHRWETIRARAGWPRGGRHEDLSARLVGAWLESQPDWGGALERDLLIHLVISHHGKGRPLVPPVQDGTGDMLEGVISGTRVEVAADLAIVDWDQPGRFRRLNEHWGPWGLALLEAIVIRSDHAVSAHGDVELEPL